MKGKFMRGIYARMTLETTLKEKYKDEIMKLKRKLIKAQQDCRTFTSELRQIQREYEAHIKELKLLKTYIAKERISWRCHWTT